MSRRTLQTAWVIISAFQRQVRLRGGVRNMARHMGALARREGMRGFLTRLGRLRGSNSGATAVDARAYQNWIDRYDSFDDTKRTQLVKLTQDLQFKPLISIMVTTCNSNLGLLQVAVESVRAQVYTNWEICIVYNGSRDSNVYETLSGFAESEPRRIKIILPELSEAVSEANNAALAVTSGEYFVRLDCRDVLPPHALSVMVRYINKHVAGKLFYSDEDCLTTNGVRERPHFKSDWNPELFLSQNRCIRVGMYETALVREVGGFRQTFGDSTDFDLALRCLEKVSDGEIVHIPHILRHRRTVQRGDLTGENRQTDASLTEVKAVQEHLHKQGISATLSLSSDNPITIRVQYALPSPQPRVSIIIPTRDGVAILRQCVDSILSNTTYANYEIIIVDNGSAQSETIAYFDSLNTTANVRIIRDDSPFNFSALNNQATKLASGEFLCLLNNDIEVISPDWLNEMVSVAAQPGNGAVGACLWYPNNTLQHGGVLVGLGGIAGHIHHLLRRGQSGYFGRAIARQNVSAITAACLVVRKSVYLEVGGLTEDLAVAFNDVDFCLKLLEAGYRNVWTPYAELYHHESASRGSDLTPEKFQRCSREINWMERRWGKTLTYDPAYNPNLSLQPADAPFSLANPPRIGQFD